MTPDRRYDTPEPKVGSGDPSSPAAGNASRPAPDEDVSPDPTGAQPGRSRLPP